MPESSNHARAPFRRTARIVLVVCWCALIYAASDTPDLRVSEDDALDLVMRKLAHLAVFAVLAILVARAIRPDAPTAASTFSVAWLATLAWSISDEWHQTFVAGRVGHASDVAIDMTGATLALAAWRLLPGPHTRRRHRPGSQP